MVITGESFLATDSTFVREKFRGGESIVLNGEYERGKELNGEGPRNGDGPRWTIGGGMGR